MKNREIISIHIGQAGSQIGNTCWELYCLEHGIDHTTGIQSLPQSSSDYSIEQYQRSFFSETKNGNWKARALFVDLDSECIDKIRMKNNSMYERESLLSGNENAGNNFAIGRGVGGSLVLENCLERIRNMVEKCEALEGFLITSSLNGGTGSGFRDALLERLSSEFDKKLKLSFDVIGAPSSVSSCVEPYNVLLGWNSIREYSDVSVILENEALIDICKNKLQLEQPKMTDLNEIIAHTISSTTVHLRKEGCLHVSISEIMNNLIPYPSVKYLIHSMSNIFPKNHVFNERPNVTELTRSCFLDKHSVLANCNLLEGQYMACVVLYKGDIVPKDVGHAISTIKTSRVIRFVDWCPTGFRCGIDYSPPLTIPGGNICSMDRNAHVFANSTSISQTFTRMGQNFDKLFSEKPFLHWYLKEGAQEEEFTQCREELRTLQQDYLEVVQVGEEEI
ncbi:alpha-tubulin [Naegleria gruberi]|uniref:Alpha-tubulin n=1 Tax=Naegleria gruberi TaxID=5762 RepID=D2UYU9_NAEGR|nr:alpha-tubulin [Naegleria gruberi]EFC49841.1 alpha-tubulin [Naegleria gruberi]|eukprot:XP_002682585.1 alpha-tubulin [Naegleria gruberi]